MAVRQSTGLVNKVAGIDVNKITNGSFTSATTGWTAVTGALTSVAGGQSGNCLQIAANSANASQAYQDIATKIGHNYRLVVYYKNGTASAGKVYVGTTGTYDAIFTSATLNNASWTLLTNTAILVEFTATATTTRITLQNSDTSNTGLTMLFDEVECYNIARSYKDLFYKGFIQVFSGSQPTLADTLPPGTLLCTFYSDGAAVGLTFDAAVGGVLGKAVAETWTGTAVATGTAGWFRMITANDLGTTNTTDERIDGAVSTAGAELNFNNLSISSGSVQTISTFSITVPQA